MQQQPIQIRQGDVMLVPVKALPADCKPIQPEAGRRFVLAHGEVTGHAHAIYEFTQDQAAEAAVAAIDTAKASAEAKEAIDRAMKLRTAQMWSAPDGEWYLEVKVPSVMKHEEHTAPTIPPGIYHAPIQVESNSSNMLRRVAD